MPNGVVHGHFGDHCAGEKLNMSNPETNGMTGGLLGTAGGGFAWIVITGFVIGAPIVSGLAVILGLVCFAGGMVLFRAQPQRRLTVIGLAIIWVALFNVIFVNFYYERIPDTIGGITSGKGAWSSQSVTVLMAVLAVVGFGIVAWEFVRKGTTPRQS